MEKREIIAFIIVLLLVAFIGFIGIRQAVLGGSVQVSCSYNDKNTAVCSQVRGIGVDSSIDAITIYKVNEFLDADILKITEGLTGQKLEDYIVSKGVPEDRLATMPTGTKRTWLNDFYEKKLGKQLLIIEGTTEEGKNTIIYGIDYSGGDGYFKLTDPFPDEPTTKINPKSIKFYFKLGGYDNYNEEKICSEFGFLCSQETPVEETPIEEIPADELEEIVEDIENSSNIDEKIEIITDKTEDLNQQIEIVDKTNLPQENKEELKEKLINLSDKFPYWVIFIITGIGIAILVLIILIIWGVIKKFK